MKKPKTIFFFYYICDDYLICSPEACEKSERTFDFQYNDFANCRFLVLNALKLYWIGDGGFGNEWTHEKRAEWFAGYLSSFTSRGFKVDNFKNLKTNPKIRILIQNEELLKKIKDRIQLEKQTV